MDKLQSMRAFAKVVQHGSFAAAARELRLSRSAVSKYVIDLEQDLGAQLLVRTTRSASPTENGQIYYESCTAILADLEEADLAVTRLQAEPRGILRVNAPMSFGTLHLGRAVADFMERYTQLHIQLILSDQQISPSTARPRFRSMRSIRRRGTSRSKFGCSSTSCSSDSAVDPTGIWLSRTAAAGLAYPPLWSIRAWRHARPGRGAPFQARHVIAL
jgi:hypothetical protein